MAEPPLWAVTMTLHALLTVPSKLVPMIPVDGLEPPEPVGGVAVVVDVTGGVLLEAGGVLLEAGGVLEVAGGVLEVTGGVVAVPGKH